MEMNHPLWPVVRESARRMVKSEDIIITAPDRFSDLIDDLSDKISEKIPQGSHFQYMKPRKLTKYRYIQQLTGYDKLSFTLA